MTTENSVETTTQSWAKKLSSKDDKSIMSEDPSAGAAALKVGG